MQKVLEYDALTFRAPQRNRWYTRLWLTCLGRGCFGRKRQRFSINLIGYDPEGKLHRAAGVGDVALVERFINGSEYYINECDRRGRTALHYACAHNHPDVVKFLTSNDCTDINIQDDEGRTPLIKATQWDNVECVNILLTQGADPHITDFVGDAALHHAVLRGNIIIAGKLLKYQDNINAKTKYGLTLYQLAIYKRQQEMADFLIKQGAEAHLVLEPNRLSENAKDAARKTEDKDPTSVIKVEGTNQEGCLPENYDHEIRPKPTSNMDVQTSTGKLPGPGRIAPKKPPRSKRCATPKPPLSPPLPPRTISTGPPGSVEGTTQEGCLPKTYDHGNGPTPTSNMDVQTSTGGTPGRHCIVPPNPPRPKRRAPQEPPPNSPGHKRRAPQKPPLSPPLPPRKVPPGPPGIKAGRISSCNVCC